MESSKVLIPLFFVFALVGGWLISDSWGGITYVYTGDGDRRLPAAIGKGMDFSELRGDALFMASQKRVIEEMTLKYDGNSVGVELGHFLTRGHNGQKQFACNKFSKVILRFVAVGTAENGESPVMEVEADCEIGPTANTMAPIWIPIDQLRAEKPANMEYKLNEPQPLDFRFDHIGSSWPKTWALSSVNLLSEKTGEFLNINQQEIQRLREAPVELNW